MIELAFKAFFRFWQRLLRTGRYQVVVYSKRGGGQAGERERQSEQNGARSASPSCFCVLIYINLLILILYILYTGILIYLIQYNI